MTVPPVLVAMCTYDGAAHLPEQLASLAAQTHRNWRLWVSDDGSGDGTRDILGRFGQARDVTVVEGPRRGAAANFLHLACHPDLPVGGDVHLAFSDQDDVWRPDKIARGLDRLRATEDGRPALYAARVTITDAAGRPTGRTPPPPEGLGLRDVFAWNPAGGHTTILNPAAVALIRAAGPVAVDHHDWWFPLLVAACGGRLEIEAAEVLSYRQHEANVVGAASGLRARLTRLGGLLGGDYGRWVRDNARALLTSGAPLTEEARRIAEDVVADGGAMSRVALLRRHGLRRRTGLETAALYAAAALGRV